MKEKAALSLGYLCVGESFPYTTEIADKIIATVKEVHIYTHCLYIFDLIYYIIRDNNKILLIFYRRRI